MYLWAFFIIPEIWKLKKKNLESLNKKNDNSLSVIQIKKIQDIEKAWTFAWAWGLPDGIFQNSWKAIKTLFQPKYY
jgi:hypothetical protein